MAVDNRNFVNKFANEGGGDVLVEDKRMEELKSATAKTSSQISTSANYIPLQDTDGNLVKINPASFEEAVRNVLGGLLANNDKGTTISGLPALSGSGAGLDFGSITPANLASVLGGTKTYSSDTVPAINQVPTDRITTFTITPSSPNRTDRKWLDYAQITYIPTSYFVTELMTSVTNGVPITYARTLEQHNGVIDSGLSRDFVRLDNFGCNTASDLASLLGVKQYVMDIPKGEYTSLGDLPDGIFWVTTDGVVQQACQDWPDGISKSGEMITFSIRRGSYGLQFMIQSYGWLCIRSLSTTWQAWKKIQLT